MLGRSSAFTSESNVVTFAKERVDTGSVLGASFRAEVVVERLFWQRGREIS